MYILYNDIYCLLPSVLQIHNSDLCFFFLFNFLILLISGKEPYHGCTDIKPLLFIIFAN